MNKSRNYIELWWSSAELLNDRGATAPQNFWNLFFIYIYLFFKIIFIYYLY